MTANELRVGNYVKYVFTPFEIDISEYRIDNGAAIQVHQNHNCYSPIPLTEEWLLKFGFELHSDYDYRNFRLPNNFFISIWMGEGQPGGFEEPGVAYWGDSIKPIYFVHQLQNLYFCLTGKELEIKE